MRASEVYQHEDISHDLSSRATIVSSAAVGPVLVCMCYCTCVEIERVAGEVEVWLRVIVSVGPKLLPCNLAS